MKMQSNERGQTIAVLAAGMFLVLLGFIGMAIDVGFLYHQKRVDQQAADAAALAVAAQAAAGNSATTAASTAVTQNGLTIGTGTGQSTVTVTPGTLSSSLADEQVSVTTLTPTYFMGLFGHSTVPVTATAEASYQTSNSACMVALSPQGVAVPNASGVETDGSTSMTWGTTVMSDIATEGNSKINSPFCGVQACGPSLNYYASGSGKTGAALYAWGSGDISASSTAAPSYGTDNSGSTITTAPTITSCGASADPLAGTLTAPTVGTCTDPSWMAGTPSGTGTATSAGNGVVTLTAPSSGAGLNLCNFNTSNVGTLHLTPGLYIFQGNFSTNSGTTIDCPTCTGGAGVTLYIAPNAIAGSSSTNPEGNGQDGINNNTTLNLTAATAGNATNGAIPGVLFWDGNTNSTPDNFTFGGGSSSTISGSIYMPNSNLTLGNGTGTTALSASIVADTIMVLGGSTITENYNPGTQASTNGKVNLID